MAPSSAADDPGTTTAAPAATRTTCPYCGVGCGVLATRAADGTVGVRGDPEHPANLGRLCSKGSALGETTGPEGRLLRPEIEGRRASWDEALGLVADRFRATLAEHGPGSVAFYVSGQLLTEDYYVANKLMKGFLGSASIDTNSRLCMSSAVASMRRAFGADHVPVSYADLEIADLVVLVGSNLAWCHPVVFQRLVAAKKARPGLKVVVIDPRRTATCEAADLHLALRPGTDAWLLNGVLVHLDRQGRRDEAFVAERTRGVEAALVAARASSPDAAAVAAACGLDAGDVATLYDWYARNPRTVTLWSQGLNQSSSGTDKGNAVINLHLLTGRIGRPGAGPFSITGQPNAMGGREVGGLSNQLAAHVDLDDEARADLVRQVWQAPRLPNEPGPKAVDMFRAVGEGRIKALWVMATNPAASLPDSDRVRDAVQACPFVVVSDCVRETDTTRLAHVLLPAAAWGEKDGTVTNSERRISRQRAFLPRAGEARPDWWIVTEVARRMGFGHAFLYRSAADVFREHCRLAAAVGTDLGLGPLAALDDAGYEALAPVTWPIGAVGGTPVARGRFFHQDGRARFLPVEPRLPVAATDEERPLLLNTGRYRDHWHTLTRTGRSPTLARHRQEPLLDLNPGDAAGLGLRDGDLASVENRHGRATLKTRLSDEILPGQAFASLHWTDEDAGAARVNALVAPVVDPISGQPEAKAAPVRVAPFRPAWAGFALSRERLRPAADPAWWARVRIPGGYRLELADDAHPDDWTGWARRLLGGAGDDWLEYRDPASGVYRAARLAEGRLEACLIVGQGPGRAAAEAALGGEMPGPARAAFLAGAAAVEDPGPLVCACFGVAERAILDAVERRRALSAADLGRLLKAGTNCGSCLPELESLVTSHAPSMAAAAE